jgi:AICAR transformylase/IMP cyclohydrolase PurH
MRETFYFLVWLALISVSDKTGLKELVAGLVNYRAIDRILASGGTAKYLKENTKGVTIL